MGNFFDTMYEDWSKEQKQEPPDYVRKVLKIWYEEDALRSMAASNRDFFYKHFWDGMHICRFKNC